MSSQLLELSSAKLENNDGVINCNPADCGLDIYGDNAYSTEGDEGRLGDHPQELRDHADEGLSEHGSQGSSHRLLFDLFNRGDDERPGLGQTFVYGPSGGIEDGIRITSSTHPWTRCGSSSPVSIDVRKAPDFGCEVFHSIHPIDQLGRDPEQAQHVGERLSRAGGCSLTFLVIAIHNDHLHVVFGTRRAGECRVFKRILNGLVGRPTAIKEEEATAYSFARFKRLWNYLETGSGR